MLMQDVNDLKPKFDNRRLAVFCVLTFICIMIACSLGGAFALAYFGKFTLVVSTYLTVFTVCSFLVQLGVIGSYIFGARWENSDFLKILPDIIPHIQKDQ